MTHESGQREDDLIKDYEQKLNYNFSQSKKNKVNGNNKVLPLDF